MTLAASKGMTDVDAIMRLTPVELMALSKGYDTRQIDEMEKLAQQAMMIRYAVLGKNPKTDKMINQKRSLSKINESYARLYPELYSPESDAGYTERVPDPEVNKALAERILADARRAKLLNRKSDG